MKAYTVIFVSKTQKAAKHPDEPARRIVSLQAKDEDEATKLAKQSEMRYATRLLRDSEKQLRGHAAQLGIDHDGLNPDDIKRALKKDSNHDATLLTNVGIQEQRADLDDWTLEGVFEGDGHLVSA